MTGKYYPPTPPPPAPTRPCGHKITQDNKTIVRVVHLVGGCTPFCGSAVWSFKLLEFINWFEGKERRRNI